MTANHCIIMQLHQTPPLPGGATACRGNNTLTRVLINPWLGCPKADSDSQPGELQVQEDIKDIVTWSQCFIVYMAVLAKAELEYSTELAAYILTITTAAQDYEHPAWEWYDRAYWDKAVVTGNKKRFQVDTALLTRCLLEGPGASHPTTLSRTPSQGQVT